MLRSGRIARLTGHGPNYFAKSTTSRTHILATATKSVASQWQLPPYRHCAQVRETERSQAQAIDL